MCQKYLQENGGCTHSWQRGSRRRDDGHRVFSSGRWLDYGRSWQRVNDRTNSLGQRSSLPHHGALHVVVLMSTLAEGIIVGVDKGDDEGKVKNEGESECSRGRHSGGREQGIRDAVKESGNTEEKNEGGSQPW